MTGNRSLGAGLVIAAAVLAAAVPMLMFASLLVCLGGACYSITSDPHGGFNPAIILFCGVAITAVSYVTAVVSLLIWQRRVRAMMGEISSVGHRLSPTTALISWFLPVASLWMPYQAIADLARAAVSAAGAGESTPAGIISWIRGWWAAWLIMQLSVLIAAVVGLLHFGSTLLLSTMVLGASLALLLVSPVVAAALLAVVVMRMSRAVTAAVDGSTARGLR